MVIKRKIDYCFNCKTYSETNYGVENCSFDTANLDNYNEYKNVYVTTCSNCGYISYDISKDAGVDFESINQYDKFKEIMDYSYLNGYDKMIYEQHSVSVPANVYEAYSFMCYKAKDYEMFFRTLSHSIQLKQVILEKYRLTVEEDNDEEDFEIFNKLEKLLKKNILENANKFVEEYLKYKSKNLFLSIMFLENLAIVDKNKANDYYLTYFQNINLENDLKSYIETILK